MASTQEEDRISWAAARTRDRNHLPRAAEERVRPIALMAQQSGDPSVRNESAERVREGREEREGTEVRRENEDIAPKLDVSLGRKGEKGARGSGG